MKRQPIERGKIFANEVTEKGLISKIHKELIQLNIKKINNPIKKMARRPKQTFLQRRYTDGQQAYEKMSNIANYQRNANQNHNEVSRHIDQKVYKSCWRGCGEKGTLLHCWWECKLVQPLWRRVRCVLKHLKNKAWRAQGTSTHGRINWEN